MTRTELADRIRLWEKRLSLYQLLVQVPVIIALSSFIVWGGPLETLLDLNLVIFTGAIFFLPVGMFTVVSYLSRRARRDLDLHCPFCDAPFVKAPPFASHDGRSAVANLQCSSCGTKVVNDDGPVSHAAPEEVPHWRKMTSIQLQQRIQLREKFQTIEAVAGICLLLPAPIAVLFFTSINPVQPWEPFILLASIVGYFLVMRVITAAMQNRILRDEARRMGMESSAPPPVPGQSKTWRDEFFQRNWNFLSLSIIALSLCVTAALSPGNDLSFNDFMLNFSLGIFFTLCVTVQPNIARTTSKCERRFELSCPACDISLADPVGKLALTSQRCCGCGHKIVEDCGPHVSASPSFSHPLSARAMTTYRS